MSLDTFLWIAAAAVPLVLAALGGHVATDRPGLKLAFWIIGVVGMVVVVVFGIRNQNAQTALQNQLNRIETNTGKQAQVTVNVPQAAPPQIIVAPPVTPSPKATGGGFMQLSRIEIRMQRIEAGAIPSANFFVINKGSEPVEGFERYFGMAVATNATDATDKEAAKMLRREALEDHARKIKEHRPMVGVGQQVWNTISLPPLSKEGADGLLRGKDRWYFYVWSRWKGAKRDLDTCEWLQAPPTPEIKNEELVWHLCND
ncbi:MAG TPA: hypothetical protein VF840_03020 [Terriglobales bacterium]